MRYYLPRHERIYYVLIVGVVVSALCSALVKIFAPMIGPSTQEYEDFLKHTWTIRFIIGFLLISGIIIIGLLWYTLREQEEINQRQAEAERLSKEAELFKLRQQLQPHFLFNSLNSISALAGSQPEKARHMIQQLSSFLRGTLKKEEQQWIPLTEEIEYLQLYLEIEKVRFGHRLQTDIHTHNAVQNALIPALLLQPIVENAIKFGLYDTTDDVLISIDATIDQQFLLVSVRNPYDPDTSSRSGTGFGLASIKRRLYLLFARNDLLTTHADNNIFTTTLKIPLLQHESNNHR